MEWIEEVLKQYGLFGVALFAMGWWIVKQQKRIEHLEDTLVSLISKQAERDASFMDALRRGR